MPKHTGTSPKACLPGDNCQGQALVEYMLLLVLIAIALMVTLSNLGTTITEDYSKASSSLQTIGGGGGGDDGSRR
jgi:Flp pilus assembly pilin Flp